MGQKYLQLPNSSWQPAVFLAAIFNPRTVFQIQTGGGPQLNHILKMHPRTIGCLHFQVSVARKQSGLKFFIFMTHGPPSILKLSLMIIFSVCPPRLVFLCFIFWWLRLQALGNAIPLCALQCQHASCLSRELWSLFCHRSALLFWK